MAIEIEGYLFEIHDDHATMEDWPAVYVVLDGDYEVVDVGEAGAVKSRVAKHERESCWEEHGYLAVGVHYTGLGEEGRREIEGLIREQRDPPCGER